MLSFRENASRGQGSERTLSVREGCGTRRGSEGKGLGRTWGVRQYCVLRGYLRLNPGLLGQGTLENLEQERVLERLFQ